MYLYRKVGERNQVVIPAEVMEEAGITQGSYVKFTIKDGKVILESEKSDLERLEEYCTSIPQEKRITGKIDLDAIFEESYNERLPKGLRK